MRFGFDFRGGELGLVSEQGELTNAGALLADESPVLCSRLFCTRWNGLNKSGGAVDALDDAEYSDRYQFTVVMPNLNYDVPQDKLNIQILDLIRKDSKISTEKIAIALGVSSKTIKRHIKEMDNVNYIGHGFSGYWKISDNE